MEKWQEILNKCELYREKKTCTPDGKLCPKLDGCAVRNECNELIASGGVPAKVVPAVELFCPLRETKDDFVPCIRDRCAFYVKPPQHYGHGDPQPCCAVVALVEVLAQVRIELGEANNISGNKLA